MKNPDLLKRVKGPAEIPNEPHFAVIIYGTRSVYIPGDVRSMTYPGHGYPASTETFDEIEHWVTTGRSALEAFITELDSRLEKKPYVVLEVAKKATVSRVTRIEF